MDKTKRRNRIFLKNDEGGEMILNGYYTIDEALDRIFYWMDRGWYIDMERYY